MHEQKHGKAAQTRPLANPLTTTITRWLNSRKVGKVTVTLSVVWTTLHNDTYKGGKHASDLLVSKNRGRRASLMQHRLCHTFTIGQRRHNQVKNPAEPVLWCWQNISWNFIFIPALQFLVMYFYYLLKIVDSQCMTSCQSMHHFLSLRTLHIRTDESLLSLFIFPLFTW